MFLITQLPIAILKSNILWQIKMRKNLQTLSP